MTCPKCGCPPGWHDAKGCTVPGHNGCEPYGGGPPPRTDLVLPAPPAPTPTEKPMPQPDEPRPLTPSDNTSTDWVATHAFDVLTRLKDELTKIAAEWKAGSLSWLGLPFRLLGLRALAMEIVAQAQLPAREKEAVVLLAWEKFQAYCAEHNNPRLPDYIEGPLDAIITSDTADWGIKLLYGWAKAHAPKVLG